jgi:hypothetical protein
VSLDMGSSRLTNVSPAAIPGRAWDLGTMSCGRSEKRKGVNRHITMMVFIAHALLELGSGLSKSKKHDGIEAVQAGACLDTIGSKCRRAYTEVLTSFVDLVLKIGEKVRGSSSDAVAAKIVSITAAPRVMLPQGFAKV